MQMQKFNSGRVILAAAVSAMSVVLMESASRAQSFVQLAGYSDATNNTGGSEGASTIAGTTLYTIASGNHGTNLLLPQITSITGLGTATPTDGTLVSEANWVAGTGLSTGISGQLWNAGSFLEMYDSLSGQVMRINTGNGTVSKYATKAEFVSAATSAVGTMQTSITVLASALTSTGDLAIVDSTKGIYQTTNQDTVGVLVSPTALTTGVGGPLTGTVNTLAVDGNLVFDGVSSQGMYEYNTTTSTWVNGPLFTPAQIEAVTGNTGSTYLSTGSFFAPDGNVYFFDQTAKDIMEFNPSSPLSTLSVDVSSAQINSIEGSTAVSNLMWYNGNIAWDNVNTVGEGVYSAVPEPTSLGLLAVAGIGLLSKRSRRSRLGD